MEDLQTWWRETTHLMHASQLASLTWVCIDANAPLVSAASHRIGDAGSEPSNEQGVAFEQFIEEMQLFVPSTFNWCHYGQHTTWTHPRGSRLRRDYILCSQAAFEWCDSSWVDTEHDTGFGHEDHLPICLRLRGWWQDIPKINTFQWDRFAFLDPILCQQFQAALQTLPIPRWDIHVNDHAAAFQQQVLHLASQFFCRQPQRRSRPRLQEPTIALIQLKRSVLDYGRQHLLLHDPEYKSHLKALEGQVRTAVQADQALFYSQLVDQLARDGDLHDFRAVYQLLTRLGGRPRHKHGLGRPLPLLRDATGTPVRTFLQQQQLWLRQFSAVEGGIPIAREALAAQMPPSLGLSREIVDLSAFPTLEQLHAKVRRLKRGKAPGPDGLPAEVIKAGAAPMLQHLTTLTTKIVAHGREPDTWRSGRLVPLHKGRSHRSDPQGYRSIFVSSFVAKLYHSVLRDSLEAAWSQCITHLQFGGRKGHSTDTPQLLLQSHFHYAEVHRVPSSALFVDFKEAFYSVIRQGLFSTQLDATAFMAAMHRLGVAPAEVAELLAHAEHDTAAVGLSPHVEVLLTDLFKGTYFEIDGLDQVSLTSRGTRPGDPVGDILFNLVMTLVLKDITAQLSLSSDAAWLGSAVPVVDLHHVGDVPPHSFCEVAFVDDLALLLRAPSLDELFTLSGLSCRIVHDVAARRGLRLNMSAGKTELICAFVGSGARAARQKIASQASQIEVSTEDSSLQLRVVHCYKHLGSWVHADAQPRHTIRARLTSARQSWGPLVRPLFRKRAVPLHTKLQIFNSLVVSRLLFNTHVLVRFTEKVLDSWEAGFRGMVAPLARIHLRGQAPFSFSTTTLCGVLRVLGPRDHVHSPAVALCFSTFAPLSWGVVEPSA